MANSAREILLQTATEAQFAAWLKDVALLRGWLYYHTYDSRRSDVGFPDVVMTRDGRLIVAELKSYTGRVSGPQQLWLNHLAKVLGVEVYLWRPTDQELIEKILA